MAERDRIAALMERPRPTIRAAMAALLLAVLGMWAASLIAGRLSLPAGAGREFAYDALFYLPFVALPVALYALRRPGIAASMRLNPLPALPTLAVISAALLSVYAASALDGLWALLLNALGLHAPEVSVELSTSGALSLAILHSAAIPAIFEELLCRALVFSAFESRGTRLAAWVSALFFALMHGNVYGLPAYLLVGAVSAFLVFALDSLYAGIAYHTVYNTVILMLLYAIPHATESAESAPATPWTSIAIDALCIGLLLYLTLRMLDRRRAALGIQPVPRTRAPLRGSEWALIAAVALVCAATSALVLMGV